jgi:LuxR family maltose regulon positive regulatory protein
MLRYAGQILAAFNSDGEPEAGDTLARPAAVKARVDGQALPEALTPRELEILVLLEHRLTNKEIAAKLCISPATVKRHTEGIYEKLNVHDRRMAVTKAQGLAILGQ